MSRSRLSLSPPRILRMLASAGREDPRAVAALARLQWAKESFRLRHPLGARHGRGDTPQLIGLRITDMCNLRCHTCGQWGDAGYLRGVPLKELRRRELPVDSYRELVDDVARAGWRPIFYIWGGEPMMYPGLPELLRHIADRGMPISLVTNGKSVAEHAELLVETCHIIHVSLDGAEASVHNRARPGVSRRHDSFAEVESALTALSEEKRRRGKAFPFLAPISCISRYNAGSLCPIHETASRWADLHIFYLSWWIDEASADEHEADFSRRFGSVPTHHRGWVGDWRAVDFAGLAAELDELRARPGPPAVVMPDLKSEDELRRYYTRHRDTFGFDECVSIYMTAEINANGDVSLCRDYNDYVVGNIAEASLVDLWRGEQARRFRASLSSEGLMPACRRCCGLMGY